MDGKFSGNLGQVLIRCNNVLYLRGVPEEDEETKEDGDKMEDQPPQPPE